MKWYNTGVANETLVNSLVLGSGTGGTCVWRFVVLSLPEAVRPLAEVETNVVFSAGAATDKNGR